MRAINPSLEIDLASICENYRLFEKASTNAEPASVVKCDAYGLGASVVGRALHRRANCRTFFVAYAEEGETLRRAIGSEAKIFVFNGPIGEDLSPFRRFDLTPVLNTPEQCTRWSREFLGASAALHIDTGMNRLGLAPEDVAAVKAMAPLNIEVVMSHLSCASDSSHPLNTRQLDDFIAIARMFPGAKKSIASSGGALIAASFAFDLVRIGVGLYGVNPHEGAANPFAAVATLTAPIIQLHEIGGGEPVGYGATFVSDRPMRLATTLLGYGDGYPRAASNKGAAYLEGVRCPIVGRVSMDLIVLDVSAVETPISIGDRAEFFGRNHALDAAAADCGTIGYELLTSIGGLARAHEGLGGRVRRRYLWNGAPAPDDLTGAEGCEK